MEGKKLGHCEDGGSEVAENWQVQCEFFSIGMDDETPIPLKTVQRGIALSVGCGWSVGCKIATSRNQSLFQRHVLMGLVNGRVVYCECGG